MSIKAGELILGVRADTDQAKRDVEAFEKRINSSTNSMGSSLASMGKKFAGLVGIALGGKALLDFGKSCIDLGSDLAEVQNVVDVVFPHMNDTVNEWSMNAAQQFGLSETMAKRYIGTFGSMAEAFGFTEAEALSMSETLTGLAGDVASFYNISQDEAYTKLKSVFSGETETLKELGIVMTQSALDQYALANGVGKTTQAMSEAEKVALRYKFVQDQLTNASGDFARTSGSWANQVRLLSLQFQSLKASIGQGLIQVLTPVVQALNVLMSKLVQVARTFTAFLQVLGFKKQDPVSTAVKNTEALSTGLGSVGDASNKASKGISKANKEAKKLSRAVAGFDQINKLTKSQSGASSSGGGGGGGGVGGGGGGLGIDPAQTTSGVNKLDKAVESMRKKWNKFLKDNPQLLKAFRSLKSALKEFFGVIKSAGAWVWKNVIKPLGKWIATKLAPPVIKAIAMAIRMVSKALKLVSPLLKFLFEKIIKPVGKYLGNTLIKAVEKVSKVFETLGDAFQEMTPKAKESFEKLSEKWDETVGNIKDFVVNITTEFSETKESIKGKVDAVVSKVTGLVVDLASHITTTASDLKDSMKSKIKSMGSFVKEISAKIKQKATDLKKTLSDKLKSMGTFTKSIGLKFSQTAKDMKNKLSSIMSKLGTKVFSIGLKFSAAAGDLKKWINTNVIDRVNNKFKGVPILKNHLIPHLAQGAFVKANTPQLAMIGDNRHQGEIVSPESKLEEMARKVANSVSGGDNSQTVALLQQIITLLAGMDLTATVSGQDLTNMVVKVHNQRAKATGRSPLFI